MAGNASVTPATTNPATTAATAPWLLLWQQLLQTWASDGSLTAAALEALQLEHTPALLTQLNELNDAWALGDFADLPPIELLSAADISGALGAYAASTASIYINSDWLTSASHEQIHAVLTEELGHHLDSLLNTTDTPGDEGELFAAQLHGIPHNSEQLIAIHQENDHAVISTGGHNIAIEKSDSNSTPIIRGNSLYTIVASSSWTGAEAKANKLGGNLASPNSAEENEYIFQAYKDSAIEYWIGINDAQNEGTWQWSSGEEVLFTNFFNGGQENPQSHGNNERDYGAIYTNHPSLGTDGTWGWASNSYSIQGIAEIPFIRHGDSAYVIVEGPTWEEAEANAVALGGHLVTINNAEENEWILDTYKDYRNTSAPNIVGERKVYIGLNDKTEEGKWEWTSGESSSWSPTWASGMPDNYGNSEDVAEYYLADTQHWRLWKRGEINDVVNEAITGLAEIPLAPNNIPIGTPTLSGDFKSGQIVSIYPSGFIDLDNFKEWTPNYSYSWEVSDDNGSTWASLTSPDATDGNESYILTSEELGKQIRGVVSYLDGHGTYEIVASEVKQVEMGEGYPIDPNIYRTPLTGAVSGSPENDFILAEPTNEHGYPINDALIIDTLGNNLIVSRNHYHGNQSWTSIHNSEIVLGEGNDSINAENLREASHSYGYGIIDSEIELGGGNNKISLIMRANAHNAIKGVAGTTINGGAGNDSLHIDIKNQTVTDVRNSAGIEDAQIDLGNGENRVFVKMNEGTAEHTSSTAEGVKHSVIITGEGKDHIEVQTDYRGISNSQISLGAGDDIVKIFTEKYGIDDSDLQLGPGDDYVEIRTNGEDSLSILGSQIHLGAGNDRIEIGRSRVEIYGGEGEDHLVLYDLSKEDAVVSINANGNTLISSTTDQLFEVTVTGIEYLNFEDGNLLLNTSADEEEPNKSFNPSKYALYLEGEFVAGNRITVDTSEIRNSKTHLEGELTYTIKWERSKDEGNTWEEVSLTNHDDYHTYSLTETDSGTLIRAKLQYVTADGATGTLLAQTREGITRHHDKVMPFSNGLKIAFDKVLTEFTREYIFTSPGTEGGGTIWGLNGEGLFENWELGIWLSQNLLYERLSPDGTSGNTGATLNFKQEETHSLVLTVGDDHGTSIYIDGIKIWSNGHTSINPGKDNGWISNETIGYLTYGDFSGDFLRYRYWHEEASPEQISTLETSLDTPVYDLAVRGGVITNGIGSGDPIVLNDSIDYTSEIIEIDSTRFIESKSSVLVRPGNYEPKGTLILNGDFKVGQTITIDESGIDDTDNFQGWTPNYEYSWEISNDNGNTWTEVTGDDATDGDDSYTLTSAEVGKQLRGVVNYLDGYGTNEVVESNASLVTPVIRGNSLYTIVDGPSWSEAEANSVKLGGHLVTINDEDENRYLTKLGAGGQLDLYIGLSDKETEGQWEWSSGEHSDYWNWAIEGVDWQINAPNGGVVENYGVIHKDNQIFRDGQWSQNPNPTWHDWNDSAKYGIAEIPFIRRGDSAYVIVEGPTWEEAEANANALGGNLVSINDQDEDLFILDNFPKQTWIGLTDSNIEGEWVWSSGQPVEYFNWAPGQPNNAGLDWGGNDPQLGQDYVFLEVDNNAWSDYGNIGIFSSSHSWWTQYGNPTINRGIAEIPLAPNNTPTGTPILTGDFKVGQTISIDVSVIEDADNFEGWTPTYEYSWEVSGDNGTTWSELTSTDATDGDDSYTLTSAEVGKQLRGVVSYLDGYGTDELVVSENLQVANSAAKDISNQLDLFAHIGGNREELTRRIFLHDDEKLIVTGYTYSSNLLGVSTNGNDDLYAAMFESDGGNAWTKIYGTWAWEEADNSTIDGEGNIYFTGTSSYDLNGQSASGNDNALVMKLKPNGEHLWTRFVGSASTGGDNLKGAVVDQDGNIYVTGDAKGTVGEDQNRGNRDIFLSKLTSDGDILWAKSWGSSQIDRSNNIEIDGSGNIYVTGYTRGDFNGMISNGGADALIMKVDPDGEVLWQKQLGGSNDDWANSVVITENGELFIGGDTHGERGEDTKDRNIFQAQLNPENGEKLWIKEYGTEGYDSGKLIYDKKTDRKMLIGTTSGDLITGLTAGDQDQRKGFIMELDEQDNARAIAQSQATNGDVHFSDLAQSNSQIYILAHSEAAQYMGTNNKGETDSYILSMPLSAINRPPTGTPTLTGDFKVGQSINIDASSIEDTDNFEDWTPTYEYSWEISDDNGSTWTELVSTDATDGNASYTLTTAEIGKQLRGVVSYLDGHGTNEVVASMAVKISNESGRLISIDTAGMSGSAGQTIAIPITINDIADVQAFDLNLQLDPAMFGHPTASPLIEPGELNNAWNLAATFNSQGLVTISGYDSQPLAAGDGTIAQLNLQIKPDAPIGDTLLDLTSASLNEGNITSSVIDQTISIIPPTFQIISSRSLPSGIALKLSDAPDLGAFNLYDGQDSSIDTPDLSLTDSSGNTIGLSAHWQASSKELILLATQPLNTGAYSLQVDSRADGLISASGDLLDGNRDGTAGDAFSATIQHIASDHSISIAHTARGAGQPLSLNGANTRDGITGLPINLSTSSALTSLSGTIRFDRSVFNTDQLLAGTDLPSDWGFTVDQYTDELLRFTASGTTPITGNNLELFRFDALIGSAADDYGATSLIHAAITGTSDPTLNPSSFESDPGLIVLAYSGDTTGNGTLSSLDASLVQRVVVGLDSGFDAHDHLNPLLLADTTGNGTLSSLDASRIQQQVVGIPFDTFPNIG